MYEYRPSTHQFYTFTIFKNGYQFLQVQSTEQQTKETVAALNAWEWLKDARSSDLKQWGLLPANYCLHCKREHDDGDCYA